MQIKTSSNLFRIMKGSFILCPSHGLKYIMPGQGLPGLDSVVRTSARGVAGVIGLAPESIHASKEKKRLRKEDASASADEHQPNEANFEGQRSVGYVLMTTLRKSGSSTPHKMSSSLPVKMRKLHRSHRYKMRKTFRKIFVQTQMYLYTQPVGN